MNPDDTLITSILRDLQERAKELNCLYRVDELLNKRDEPLDAIFREIIEVLPSGWQFPQICQARIVFEDRAYQADDYVDTLWVQSAYVVVQGQPVGTVEVSYRHQMPRADEGPFLKEERKLIDSVAERIAGVVMERRLKTAFKGWEAVVAGKPQLERREWWIVLDFLRGTDPGLLVRISRKMINYLSWSGVQEARDLLSRFVPEGAATPAPGEENRPLQRGPIGRAEDLTEEVFLIADRHLGEGEILVCLTKWIKEENSSFLVKALENQDTPLGEICEAIERYRHTHIDEEELSLSTQKGVRVSLARRMFSEHLSFVNVAKNFIQIRDYYDLITRIVLPPRCHGKLGGKSAGLFLAKRILEKVPEADELLRSVKVPKTWYVPSDALLAFIHYNDLEDVLNRKYMEIDQVRQEYPHLVQLFKNSAFPPTMAKGLAAALDDFGDRPLIVRSSSLLEDRSGSAFSGKYKSLFLGNQGTRSERMAALADAIAEVYASVFGPDPMEYRAERNMLDLHEEMGILIQEVVGERVGRYFFPAFSGVAFSNNEFRWSARIKRSDGLIRLVPGLGTRAVDRVADDYPVLIAPGQPSLRVNITIDEILRYSPQKMDVINLETNEFETVNVRDLLRECGNEIPQIRQCVSVVDLDRVQQPIGPMLDFDRGEAVFTFDGLVRNTRFVQQVRELLNVLAEKIGSPVDLEFASDGRDFYLLQCRPQSYGADVAPAAIPQDLPREKIVFSADRYVSNGRVPDITHLVYVDPEGYGSMPDLQSMKDVGRAVGRLNKLLPKRQFVLIGPGRWGSRGDIRLGVPVTYSDINNTAMLVEVARKKGNYLPDLSFGTHFFQDLVEASIRYLPLYPDEPGTTFNELFFNRSHNMLSELLPDFAHLDGTLRVIDVPRETNGQVLRVLMNADLEQAVAFLTTVRQTPVPAAAGQPLDLEERPPSEDHWRWRMRMAHRIAALTDPARFGIVAMYLFGSTKNATAGPGSDIDLLVHIRGTREQEDDLRSWLRGWGQALAEVNFLRTGYRTDDLLDVHVVRDEDIERQTSFASRIDAVTDAARPLEMGPPRAG